MTGFRFLVAGIGAAAGAWLRWVSGAWLNALFPAIPMGTLTANLIGGYVIGAAVAFFTQAAGVAPEWRLFIATGFCGGLTTSPRFRPGSRVSSNKGAPGYLPQPSGFTSAVSVYDALSAQRPGSRPQKMGYVRRSEFTYPLIAHL